MPLPPLNPFSQSRWKARKHDMENRPDEFARFVSAQSAIYEQVRRELSGGCKKSHWIWFIFPQLRGLGQSAMSKKYAIPSLRGARRYLMHELLGPRLLECTGLVLAIHGRGIDNIFGSLDAMKFHSCMTLFSLCAEEGSVFSAAMKRYFAGMQDTNTLRLLRERGEVPAGPPVPPKGP